MKGSREIRKWINALRSWHGRKNGVIPWFDDPWMENKHLNSKKRYRRNRMKIDD